MKLSPLEEYGLRCLMQLAKHQAQPHPITIREIAESEGLSTAYVGKLMFLLNKAHLVQATRGVQGGYALIKKPSELTLEDVFSALDPHTLEDVCEKFTGQEDTCVHVSACILKSVLGGLNQHVNAYLRRITLASLVPEAQAAQL
jgi:Rrf2 family protein